MPNRLAGTAGRGYRAAMGWLDGIATFFGILCVALAARRSLWTFPAAIVSVLFLGLVVWRERLYSDALLQGFFIAANLYGWRDWRRARDTAGAVRVARMSRASRLGWAGAWLGTTVGWGAAMHAWTNAAYPWWDAGIAAASVIAQVLMARRRIEHWVIWIAVDLASVPLYLARGLWAFAGLYVIYLAISVWGMIGWRRAMRE